jgi:hypothetical protein
MKWNFLDDQSSGLLAQRCGPSKRHRSVIFLLAAMLFCPVLAPAQMVVSVLPVQVVGQKAVVQTGNVMLSHPDSKYGMRIK